MKKVIIVTLLTINTITGRGQSSVEDLLVGQWTTIDQFGDSGVFYFDKNKTMYISSAKGDVGRGETIVEGGRSIKMLMKYQLNLDAKPIQIDFYYYVDNFYNPVGKSEGIIEVLDNNTIWFAMNFNRPTSIRPKDFKNIKESGVIFRSNTKNTVQGCKKFKDGKFKFEDAIIGSVTIERKGDLQLQTTEKGEKTKLRVEWLDDCSYNLVPEETYINNTWSRDTTGLIMNVRIVHTKEKSYIYTTSYNKSRFRFTGELIKVRD